MRRATARVLASERGSSSVVRAAVLYTAGPWFESRLPYQSAHPATGRPRGRGYQGSTWRTANTTLAGRSARRRMYHGYQCSP
jgi:hypothetical protein